MFLSSRLLRPEPSISIDRFAIIGLELTSYVDLWGFESYRWPVLWELGISRLYLILTGFSQQGTPSKSKPHRLWELGIYKDIGRFSQVPHNSMPVYRITYLTSIKWWYTLLFISSWMSMTPLFWKKLSFNRLCCVRKVEENSIILKFFNAQVISLLLLYYWKIYTYTYL